MELDLKTHFRESAGFILLVLLIYQLFLSTLIPEKWFFYSNRIAIWLILLIAGFTLKKWGKPVLSLLVIVSAVSIVSNIFSLSFLSTLSIYTEVLILTTVIGLYIYQTSKAQHVSVSVILQSINGYLLLGLISGLIITIIWNFDQGAFSFPDSFNSLNALNEAQYYGLVTFSTLGYGDVVPLSPVARSLSNFIAISGQLYLAIIVAMLVGKFSSVSKKV